MSETIARVAKSNNQTAAEAGAEAAQAAFDALGDRSADLVLVLATAGYHQQELLDAISEIFVDVPMVGCSAEGLITRGESDEGSHAVAVMAVASETIRFETFRCHDLGQDSSACGEALAEAVVNSALEDKVALLIFPDGLTPNFTQLLSALENNLPPSIHLGGGTASDMMHLTKTYQYHDGVVYSDSVSALLIAGAVEFEQVVSHGCEPIGLECRVTEARGRQIVKINDRPAWETVKEYLEESSDPVRNADLVLIALGERLGGSSTYGEHIIRTPLAYEPTTGAITVGVELEEGTPISMMRRVPHHVAESAVLAAHSISGPRAGERPALILQFDCAARGRDLFGARLDKMAVLPLQRVFDEETPWLGFYTFGEIAALQRRTHFHNYTVVLCALYDIAP